jgi:hypothetical protein
MPTRTLLLLILSGLLASSPTPATAQGFALAARGGTMGLGAEAAVGLGSRLAIRGGVGLMPLEPGLTIDDIDYSLRLPETWFNLGADLHLVGGLRVGGGILFKSDDPSATASLGEPVEIGGQEFTPEQVGSLRGTLDSADRVPYVILGFGRQVGSGVGLFLDLGVGFTGEPEVHLEAEGGAFPDPALLRARLDAEEADFQEGIPSYLDYWPILNLGLKVGLGG